MQFEVAESIEVEALTLLDSGAHPSKIIIAEQHPDYPGYLSFEPLDEDSRQPFLNGHADWLSRFLILNELYLLEPFVDLLVRETYLVRFAPSAKEVLEDYARWSKPLKINGFKLIQRDGTAATLYPYQQFSLNRALERAEARSKGKRSFHFGWGTGTGKSMACAAGAQEMFNRGQVDLVLAFALRQNKRQLARFFQDTTQLTTVVNDHPKPQTRHNRYHGSGNIDNIDVFVLNFEKAHWDYESILELIKDKRVLFIFDEALALDTSILTTKGWKTVGTVQVGDQVPGSKGWVTVVRKSSVFTDMDCYCVTTQDGGIITCSANHVWSVCAGEGESNLVDVNTEQLRFMVELFESGWSRRPVRIAIPHGVEYDERDDLPLDPYLMGYWLGDGESSNAHLFCSPVDLEELRAKLESRNFVVTDRGSHGGALRLHVTRTDADTRNGRSVRSSLIRAGVLNNKHIPLSYLTSSRSQRLELLRGLMDSDGWCSSRGDVAAFTQRPGSLLDSTEALLRSLGYSPQKRELNSSGFITNEQSCQLSWLPVAEENPFSMTRKAFRVRSKNRVSSKKIVSVEPTESVAVQCIEVDSGDHLFAVGDSWMLTHNCHKITTDDTKTKARKALEGLIRHCDSTVWTMSASVVQESPFNYRDVFSIPCSSGVHPLGTKTDFERRYVTSKRTLELKGKNGGQFTHTFYHWNLPQLHEVRHRVGHCAQNVRKTDPSVREHFQGLQTLPEIVSLSPDDRRLYETIQEEAYGAHSRHESLAPYYNLMRYVCNNPEALTKTNDRLGQLLAEEFPRLCTSAHCNKLEMVLDKCEEIKGAGDKVVLFTKWTNLSLFLLVPHLERRKIRVISHWGTGMSEKQAEAAVNQFKTDHEVTVFASSDAGAYGLNLQEARYVINYECPYSYDVLTQRSDRIDRADSWLDGLTSYVYVTENTVEERIWGINDDRRRLAAATTGANEVNSYGEEEDPATLEYLVLGKSV